MSSISRLKGAGLSPPSPGKLQPMFIFPFLPVNPIVKGKRASMGSRFPNFAADQSLSCLSGGWGEFRKTKPQQQVYFCSTLS